MAGIFTLSSCSDVIREYVSSLAPTTIIMNKLWLFAGSHSTWERDYRSLTPRSVTTHASAAVDNTTSCDWRRPGKR